MKRKNERKKIKKRTKNFKERNSINLNFLHTHTHTPIHINKYIDNFEKTRLFSKINSNTHLPYQIR